MQTVAAISFRDNHSLSMDVENVSRIEISPPREVDNGVWFCELMVRNAGGTVVLNLVADEPGKLQVVTQSLE
ncbi:MAG: hypothetical protein HYU59_01920 [Magnetospirillum gryphiswaldense]|nr:hypothetical protein [Magnetospirillum gryphiswaldense]